MNAFRSRWGHHPCSYQDYLEFKEYHKLLLHDYRQHRRWTRWNSKLEHNRVDRRGVPLPRPRWCNDLLPPGQQYAPVYAEALAAYRDLRRPQPTPELVRPLAAASHWRHRLQLLRTHYEVSATGLE